MGLRDLARARDGRDERTRGDGEGRGGARARAHTETPGADAEDGRGAGALRGRDGGRRREQARFPVRGDGVEAEKQAGEEVDDQSD